MHHLARPAAELDPALRKMAEHTLADTGDALNGSPMVQFLFLPMPFGQYGYVACFTPGGGDVQTKLEEGDRVDLGPGTYIDPVPKAVYEIEFEGQPLQLQSWEPNEWCIHVDQMEEATKDEFILRRLRNGHRLEHPQETIHLKRIAKLIEGSGQA